MIHRPIKLELQQIRAQTEVADLPFSFSLPNKLCLSLARRSDISNYSLIQPPESPNLGGIGGLGGTPKPPSGSIPAPLFQPPWFPQSWGILGAGGYPHIPAKGASPLVESPFLEEIGGIGQSPPTEDNPIHLWRTSRMYAAPLFSSHQLCPLGLY